MYYDLPFEMEAIIEAKTKKEAVKKIKEVIGFDVKVRGWEYKEKDNVLDSTSSTY